MNTPRDNYELALLGDAMGHRFIPVAPGTKVPLVKWKPFQQEKPTAEQYARWFQGTRNNIALLCGDLVVVDCDSPEKVASVIDRCGDTPHKVRTPGGGMHLGYRARAGVPLSNMVKVKGEPIDLRVRGGLEIIPNSSVDGRPYAWLGPGLLPVSALPVFKATWTRTRKPRRTRPAADAPTGSPAESGRIRFPEAYCMRIESVQGQNGSRGLVRVVCVMRDAGRTPNDIFAFVKTVWGPARCKPEWSDREIRHCIDRHCR